MNVDRVREQFAMVRERPAIAYFDYGASAPKPDAVLDQERRLYERHYANVHRGVHRLSQEASHLFEKSRTVVATAMGTTDERVVFTGGTTDALNQLASSLAWFQKWGPGDEVLVTELEHHANLLPWQMWAQRTGATLRYVPLKDDGTLDDATLYINERTKVFAFAHLSNVLGSQQPVRAWTEAAHKVGAFVVVDGAQAFAHLPTNEVNVADLGVDAYVFSAHKAYGPTGLGVMYLNDPWLNALPPAKVGGGMVEVVSMDQATFSQGPGRHEAGTPPIAQVVGLAAAVRWMDDLGGTVSPGMGRSMLVDHETQVMNELKSGLIGIAGVDVIGHGVTHHHGCLTFTVKGAHAHDVGTWLDQANIAVRVGHHCAMPLMQRLGVTSGVRASIGATTTMDEVAHFLQSVQGFTAQWGRAR